ncbi:MAG: DUF1579 family protein [Lysobacter sp.]|nr:DUF1579 family protein [Lysobacter sp.]
MPPLRPWCLAAMFFCVPAFAQAAPPPACEAPEYRQFDFWLGAWEVDDGLQNGRVAGQNTITRVASGCALREHWVNAGGKDGHSLNAYDREAQRWTQFWIGSDGVVLRLSGGLRDDGAMAMEGTLPDGKGGAQRQRIVWTPNADGSVVQRWDTSDDDGGSWRNAFVGVYRRKAAD